MSNASITCDLPTDESATWNLDTIHNYSPYKYDFSCSRNVAGAAILVFSSISVPIDHVDDPNAESRRSGVCSRELEQDVQKFQTLSLREARRAVMEDAVRTEKLVETNRAYEQRFVDSYLNEVEA